MKGKGVNTGTPIRKQLFEGDKNKGLEICGFDESKPVVMMMGGSLGAQKINKVLRADLKEVLDLSVRSPISSAKTATGFG